MIGMPTEAEAIAPKRELYGYITETGERAKRGMGFFGVGGWECGNVGGESLRHV